VRVLSQDQRLLLLGPGAIGDVKVIGIVRRCHLEQTRAESLLDGVVGRNRNEDAGKGNLHPLPLEALVAAVLRIEDEPDVAEHRFRPRGRDRYEPGAVLERILDVIQIALRLMVLRLFI